MPDEAGRGGRHYRENPEDVGFEPTTDGALDDVQPSEATPAASDATAADVRPTDDNADSDTFTSALLSGGDKDPEPARRRGFFRRHKVLTSLLALIALLVGSVVGFGLYLNSKLSDIETYASTLTAADRVEKAPMPSGAEHEPMNILLLGADASSGKSIAEQLSAGTWDAGSMRSDVMMLLHIPADRSQVYLMSFPRDSWIDVPDYGLNKINAAFSYGGPDLALLTVEQYTQVYIDHVMMIDWDGFKALTDAIGGVDITVPGEGRTTMDGEEALDYVRTRYTLPNGDFDRVKRQQNFLRELMSQTLNSVSVTDPLGLVDILDSVTANMTVDDEFTPQRIRSLAWELRSVRPSDVTFFTVPTTGTGMEGEQSVVYLDHDANKELFAALNDDALDEYVASHEIDALPSADAVN